MSAMTHLLDKDITPYLWAGDYKDILNHATDIPLVEELRNLLEGTFKLTLRISNIKGNLYVNSKPCLVRKSKFKPITVYPNCKIIEGTDLGYGGSNNYPHISFKENYCMVEIITNGFPHLELKTYKMKVKVLGLEKLTK